MLENVTVHCTLFYLLFESPLTWTFFTLIRFSLWMFQCTCCLLKHTSSPPSSTRVQLPESGPEAAEFWFSCDFRCARNSARCLWWEDWRRIVNIGWCVFSLIRRNKNKLTAIQVSVFTWQATWGLQELAENAELHGYFPKFGSEIKKTGRKTNGSFYNLVNAIKNYWVSKKNL